MAKLQGRIEDSMKQNLVKMDIKDKKILSILSEDSRIPLNKIAKKVQLSRDAVNYRIKRMEKENIIIRFFPIINLEKFGFETFHINFLVDEMDKGEQDKMIEYLKNNPNVKNIIEYSDRWDYEIVLIAKTVREFDKIVENITSKFPQLIFEKEKMQVIRGYTSIHLPLKFYQNCGIEIPIQIDEDKDIKLDNIDLVILENLCENCRTSSVKIASKVNLTADAISYRIKRLFDANVIRKFTILINLSMLNYHWFTFNIAMKTFTQEHDKKFKEYVRKHPFILRAVKTLGVWDFMLYIVADSPKHFHSTVKEIKMHFSQIVRNHQTLLAYREHLYVPLPKAIKLT